MEHTIILGSAFAVANADQENSYLLYQSNDRVVLVDCGNNPVGKLQKAGIQINQITDLILTHAHADHMSTLPLLLMDMWLRKRTTTLKVYGLPVTLEKASALLDIFTWKKWMDMFPVEFSEVAEDRLTEIIDSETLRIITGPVLHLIPTIGVRAEFKDVNEIVTYSCDGEPSEGLNILASGTDTLIQEAAGPGKGHTSPEQAGMIANKSGAKKLVLIHYDATRDPSELIEQAQKAYSGNVILARDLIVIN